MADLLDRIRAEISSRLCELRPLVDDHRRLDGALQALREQTSKAAVAPPAGSPARGRGRVRVKAPARPRKRTPRGANREAVLRAVTDRPGATSAELAAVSGVGRNTLNGLLARLVKDGELQKRSLPTGRMGYALSDVRAAPPAGAASTSDEGADDTDATPTDSAAE